MCCSCQIEFLFQKIIEDHEPVDCVRAGGWHLQTVIGRAASTGASHDDIAARLPICGRGTVVGIGGLHPNGQSLDLGKIAPV